MQRMVLLPALIAKFRSLVGGSNKPPYPQSPAEHAKDFAEYGGHPCKICSVPIPANKKYCAACYLTYRQG